MSLGLLFWVLMLVWLICGVGLGNYPGPQYVWGRGILLFLLLLALGWHSFGAPVH
jgi:hypothetical protein